VAEGCELSTELSTTAGLACGRAQLKETLVIAYVDPGSGSLLLSLILGGFAGLATIVKMRWQVVRKVFGRRSKDA
jgi:hypothetical protein